MAILAVALALAACAGKPVAVAQTPPEAPVSTPAPDLRGLQGIETSTAPKPATASRLELQTLDGYLTRLRAVSCPAGVDRIEPASLAFTASPVPLQAINPKRSNIGALTYVGGFHLTSPDKRFGGLSDLKVLPDGNLLAVSDQGDFVWLDLEKDGVTPAGARIATLLDAAGKPLDGKREADAEGLAYRDGLAFVSFERDHRVLAYDVGACGAAARGAPLVFGGFGRPFSQAFAAAHIDVPDNTGVEALGMTPDGFLATGLEQSVNGQGPLSLRPVEAAPEFDLRIEKGAPDFVGIDLLPEGKDGRDLRAFTLHRGFDTLLGNAIVISETHLARYPDPASLPARTVSAIDARARERFRVAASRRLAEMSLMFTVDNYEGVAVRRMPDGRLRLYLISDDNFSARQRTLLMVFDLPK